MLGLSQIQIYIIGGLLAVALTAGGITLIYHKGETEGSSSVTSAVEHKAVETLDRARQTKEQADRDTLAKPYKERVEGLR